MNLEIELTETGYIVRLDGALFVEVPYDPRGNDGKVAFASPEAAQAHADAYVASLTAPAQEIAPTEATPQ